jgi:hypothetical protein
MKPLATLVIRPLNVTPAAEKELSVAIPAGTYVVAMMDMAREMDERLDYGASLSNGDPDVAFNVVKICDALAWALSRVSMPQVMGNDQRADAMRKDQRAELDAAHEPLYAFLHLYGCEFFCQDSENEYLEIGHWAQTKTEAAQFPQRPRWEAARMAYERLRVLQREAESKE